MESFLLYKYRQERGESSSATSADSTRGTGSPKTGRKICGALRKRSSNLVKLLIHAAEVYASNRLFVIEQFLLVNGSL